MKVIPAATVNPWILSLAVSLVYLGVFLQAANRNDPGNELLFGFCLAGFPLSPDRKGGCHHDIRNSHMASFLVDTGMGTVAYYLYERLKRRTAGKLNPRVTIYFVFMAAVVLSHGFLHLCLSEFLNCYIPPESIPIWLMVLGRLTLGSFAFLLCVIILGVSFAQDGANVWARAILPSLLLSGLVVFASLGSGVEWVLPALFSVSHPLSCVAALFSNTPAFTQHTGWAFLIASCMGILELTQCDPAYRSLGGHVLYDFWLHVAVLLSLPPFAPPIAPLVEKE